MTDNETTVFEILKVVASFLTPIVVGFLGLSINKNLEKSKKALLQEKEWQVRWAETFLTKAIEFEENISMQINYLFQLQNSLNSKDAFYTKERQDDIIKAMHESSHTITFLDWDIQNFAQFADKNNKELIEKQKALIAIVGELFEKKQGDAEKIRIMQFEYNQLVRLAHNEILNKRPATNI